LRTGEADFEAPHGSGGNRKAVFDVYDPCILDVALVGFQVAYPKVVAIFARKNMNLVPVPYAIGLANLDCDVLDHGHIKVSVERLDKDIHGSLS